MEKIRTENVDPVELYLAEIAEFEPVTEEEKATLPPLLKEKDPHAVERMTVAYLMQVVDIAREYKNLRDPHVIGPVLDLIQEGNTGLVKAVETHDWDHPEDFPAYVYRRICLAMEDSILNSCVDFRIPTPSVEALRGRTVKEPQKPGRKPEIMPDADYEKNLPAMLDAPAGSRELRQYLERNGLTFHDRDWQAVVLWYGLDGNIRHCRKDISLATGLSMRYIDLTVHRLSEPIRRRRRMERRQERQQK